MFTCFFCIFQVRETSNDHYEIVQCITDFHQCCMSKTVVEGKGIKLCSLKGQ